MDDYDMHFFILAHSGSQAREGRKEPIFTSPILTSHLIRDPQWPCPFWAKAGVPLHRALERR